MKRFLTVVLLSSLASFSVWADGTTSLTQTHWVATRINGTAINGEPPTLTIDQNRAYGSSGCNRFTGNAMLSDNNSLRFGQMASTRMACQDPAGLQEVAYFKALSSVTGYHLNQSDLILLDKDFNKVVEFRTMPESPPH